MSETNTATPTAPATTEAAKPAVKKIVAQRPVVKTELKLTLTRVTTKVKVQGPDGKPVKDDHGKVQLEDKVLKFAVPVVETSHDLLNNSEHFSAFFTKYLTDGNAAIPNFLSVVLDRFGITEFLQDVSEYGTVTKDGKSTVDPVKYTDALFNGPPRSANTSASITKQLAEARAQYGDLCLVFNTYKDNPTALESAVKDSFGYPSTTAFGIAMTETAKKIQQLTQTMRQMAQQKAEREAEKAKHALATPPPAQ